MRLKLPTRQIIRDNRWLRWMAPFCGHPRLWHFNRRGVAAGIALGIFFGLLIPIAQIPFAAGTAVLLRANVPVAIGSTLVTNPVTVAPVYIAAYYLGSAVLGVADAAEVPMPLQPEIDTDPRWWGTAGENVLGVGKPLVVGLAIVAVAEASCRTSRSCCSGGPGRSGGGSGAAGGLLARRSGPRRQPRGADSQRVACATSDAPRSAWRHRSWRCCASPRPPTRWRAG